MNVLRAWTDLVLAWILIWVARLVLVVALRISVVGSENAPTKGPVIITANHFSWFDAPLLTIFLPYRPSFLVASESQRFWFVRLYMHVFQGIPIWRGQVDRTAITMALHRLNEGETIGIFPEGGIDPRFRMQRERGEVVSSTYGHTSRSDGQLTHPEPGTAYLAIRSSATILPVGLIGTERILGNMLRLRRTNVTVRIGEAFGPLKIEPSLGRLERRRRMDLMSEEIMLRIAELFPPENRGPYRTVDGSILV